MDSVDFAAFDFLVDDIVVRRGGWRLLGMAVSLKML